MSMGTSDFLLVGATCGGGVLCSVGGALMLASSEPHRKAARAAFYAAGVSFWATGVIWGISAGEETMLTRLIIAGGAGALSAMFAVWTVSLTASAQTPPPSQGPGQGAVVGHEVIGNNQGGAAEEIISNGQLGQPSFGGQTTVVVPPGQSAKGTRVIQTGLGTGLRVIQTGPGVGYSSTVIVGPPPSGK